MKFWMTKEGKKLAIKDMTSQHINNCIRMLERQLATKPDEAIYIGKSEAAESAVAAENRINDELANRLKEAIRSFEFELRLREEGKPIGEDFPLPIIQRWELPDVEEE